MHIPEIAVLLAGFTLAHAAWSVSDLPQGELLVPLVISLRGEQRNLERFEAETQEAAIANAKAAVKSSTADAWAFAREGIWNDGSQRVDVLIVEFWAKGMQAPVVLIQRFEPYAKRNQFRLLGEPDLVIAGVIQSFETAGPILQLVRNGIKSHSRAGPLWSSWRAPAPRR